MSDTKHLEKTFDVVSTINNALERALQERGQANVVIAGKTGVGKSTLINAVFQGRMAETGQGRPVTQHMRKITKQGIPVSIYDTRGLELKDYRPILAELMTFIENTNRDPEPTRHIHVAWVCIAEGSRRVEEAEVLLVNALAKHMPVIVVITTATSDNGFKSAVEKLLPAARNVIRVNSEGQLQDGGSTVPKHGLEHLVEITMEVIPEGQKKAFVAAQRVKISEKVDQSHRIVAVAALSAGGIGAMPIPFSDAIGIVPIQIGMLASISAVFGLSVDHAFMSTVVSSVFSGSLGILGGRALVGAILKFFPGANLAGMVISGSVAAAATTFFGEAYILTLATMLAETPDREISAADVSEAFKRRLKV